MTGRGIRDRSRQRMLSGRPLAEALKIGTYRSAPIDRRLDIPEFRTLHSRSIASRESARDRHLAPWSNPGKCG